MNKKLLNRYLYLYENKELILSSFIFEATEKKKYAKLLKEIKRDSRSFKKALEENTAFNVTEFLISSYENALKTKELYLFNNIKKCAIKTIEDFLFADGLMESTALYIHIESLKSNKFLLELIFKKIEALKDRRSRNKFTKDRNCFTVWRILDYVRNANINNQVELKALDKYYNIDRYIATKIESNSGYGILEEEIEDYRNYASTLSPDYIVGKYETDQIYSAVILEYEGNEFEKEDNYNQSQSFLDILYEGDPKNFISKSIFMSFLANSKMLTTREKEKIRRVILEKAYERKLQK